MRSLIPASIAAIVVTAFAFSLQEKQVYNLTIQDLRIAHESSLPVDEFNRRFGVQGQGSGYSPGTCVTITPGNGVTVSPGVGVTIAPGVGILATEDSSKQLALPLPSHSEG